MTKKITRDRNDSWVVRGVTHEARNAAKMAAKHSDEFVGVWLSRKVLEAAQQDLTGKKEVARPEDVYNLLSELSNRFDKEFEAVNARLEGRKEKKTWLQKWRGK